MCVNTCLSFLSWLYLVRIGLREGKKQGFSESEADEVRLSVIIE